ncbi:MAG TPA: protein kinase, partial [Myxococcaceae bacterium]|nr:protein kinase [Myxococcaceae bacterium]
DFEPSVVAWRKPVKGRGPGRLVLIKRVVLPPEQERRQRAAEEVRLASYLEHPHISRVLGLEWHQGSAYVVTEYLEGCFLETAMEAALLKRDTLSPTFAAFVAAVVADALHFAHHRLAEGGLPLQLVHRAVSPMSIRLGLAGEVKLGDFGLAWSRLPGRLPTPPRVLRSDVAYAAPEVFRFQPLDGRADLYSLGLVLLEVLTGQYPLDPPDVRLPPGESLEVDASVRAERPAWAPVRELAARVLRFGPEDVERLARDVPEGLKRIVHRALRANPEERYPTGAALRDALCDWLRGQGQPFGRETLAAELAHLVREPPSPHEAGAFPTEQGVLPTPEQAARARAARGRRRRRERP